MTGYHEGECPTCNEYVELEYPDDAICPHCDAIGIWVEDNNDENWWVLFEWDYDI